MTCKLCDKPIKARGLCSGHYDRWLTGKRGAALSAPLRVKGDAEILDSQNLVYDEEWKKFCEWIGLQEERKAKVPGSGTMLAEIHGVLSDLHIPFHDMPVLLEAVKWLKEQGVTILHLGGDVADHYNLSRFSQYESVDIQYEAIECRKVLDYLSRNFSKVNVIAGNHEAREQKYLSSKLPPDLLRWFLNKSFLERITEDMPNVSVIKHKVNDFQLHWVLPIGEDLVLTHAETVSKIALRAADNVRAWMDNWHDVIDIYRPRVILQSHTHQAGIAPLGRQVICETGCMCKIQGYALQPKLYGKPQVQAATVFMQVKGKTDVNSIRQRYFGI